MDNGGEKRENTTARIPENPDASQSKGKETLPKPKKWSLGVLNDKETDEVPGMLAILDLRALRPDSEIECEETAFMIRVADIACSVQAPSFFSPT